MLCHLCCFCHLLMSKLTLTEAVVLIFELSEQCLYAGQIFFLCLLCCLCFLSFWFVFGFCLSVFLARLCSSRGKVIVSSGWEKIQDGEMLRSSQFSLMQDLSLWAWFWVPPWLFQAEINPPEISQANFYVSLQFFRKTWLILGKTFGR